MANYDALPTRNRSIAKAIVLTGLLAGSLDLLTALLTYSIRTGNDASLVLKFIASGLFGKKAFTSGPEMTLWGLLFHFVISLLVTFLFFLVVPKFRPALRHPLITGIMYGSALWVIMNLLILPLSKIPVTTARPVDNIIGILTLVVMVGIPISLLASKFYKRTIFLL
jgi:hypothetical protein